MADLTSDLSRSIRQMEAADLFTEDNIKRVLQVGVETLEEPLPAAFTQAGHNRTGATRSHITHSRKVRRGKRDNVPYMFVTITGEDKRGQRYGTKAFVLNYGRRKGGRIPASHWWNNSVAERWPAVERAMVTEIAKIVEGD